MHEPYVLVCEIVKNEFYIVLVIFCAAGALHSNDEPLSNLSLLQSLYEELLNDVLAEIDLVDSVAVIKKPQVRNEYNWLIESAIFQQLQERGLEHIYINPDTVIEKRFVEFGYQSLQQAIDYKKLKSKKIQRQINAKMNVTVLSQSGEIFASQVEQKTKTDTLSKADFSHIENKNYAFTRGEKKQTLLGKVKEPVIVSIITGFIIYLFYSYRSK